MTFSPSYIYNQLEDDPSCHSGAFLSDGLAILKTKGALPLSEFPYQRLSCTRQPTDKEHEVASRYKIFDYGRINENVPFSLDDLRYMKQAIASNYPVILGLETDDNFHSFTRRTGGEILSTPYDPTTRKGAHAVVMVGYDEDKKSVLLQNSWGNSWGNEGLAWVSYAYLLTAGFEAYIVKEAVAQ
jgi:hypothetical protein